MSALRNVGELASPYFLTELWVRRGEVDIDPETFSSLKRKARTLVRDARIAGDRGDPVDAEWRARRRDLLSLNGMEERTAYTEAGPLTLHLWRDAQGRDCVAVAELDPGVDPDARGSLKDLTEPPATAFELALDAAGHDAEWGLLLAGLEVRLYRRASGISQQYLALDLDGLVELDDEDHWLAFAGLFRAPAFVPDAEGVPLIRRVVDESRRHAAALAEDMRVDVIAAAEAIIQGVLDHPANREVLGGTPSRDTLHRLFEETLFYLYRLLFALYAEAREILPLAGGGAYATTYSVDHLVELARKPGLLDGDTSYFGDALRRLFQLLWHGPPELAHALGVEPVDGDLFDPARTSFLDRCIIPDRAWKRALRFLAVGAPGSPRGRLGRRSSFAELGVDQLGSIYEGLLVLEPHYVDAPRVLVRVDGEPRVLDPADAGDLPVERELRPGDFVLESASGRRKGTGSFYTPAEITEFLVHACLDPLLEPILAEAEGNPGRAARKILALRVCDPAMGSGAFLVQASRVLGQALARVRAKASGRVGSVTPKEIKRAQREVVRHCLYGVDLNPLAVALAKVSLWLETLQEGQPLTFLDAHLRVGDSLVGGQLLDEDGSLTLKHITTWPKDAVKGLRRYLSSEAGLEGKPMLEALKDRRALPARTQEPLPGLGRTEIEEALEAIAKRREEIAGVRKGGDPLQLELKAAVRFRELEEEADSLRNRIRAAADFWCAQWFWPAEAPAFDRLDEDWSGGVVPPPGEDAFNRIVGHLLDPKGPLPKTLARQLEVARRVARERHFFHWDLEFPEVIVDRGGFDVVVGNPPWNTLSPDVKEFFSTYDPVTFRKGVPKRRQTERKEELRTDPDIDARWRAEARWLHELSAYVKPESGHFRWYAPEGNLRKGDANVFRLFVERAYGLLRRGGRFGQVLPESFYVSSPATGLRQHLLREGRLVSCYVFENRKQIFPIGSNIKIALVSGEAGAGPTEEFRAAFFVGKDAAGRARAVGLDELPAILAELEVNAPTLSAEQIKALAPATWSFPELQTALDADIAAHCATKHPPLNLDDRGWGLRYCRELDADKDAWRFHTAEQLERAGAVREGLRWRGPDGQEWWPLVEGYLIHLLEFPAPGKEPKYWVNGAEVRQIEARRNPDGSSVMDHYRVAWRDVARSIDERSAIACVLPPRTAAKDSSLTVWGGSLDPDRCLALASVMSSFVFDYLVRFGGKTHLKYSAMDPMPVPAYDRLAELVPLAAEVVASSTEFEDLWRTIRGPEPRPALDAWAVGERRAKLDAHVALAYGLSLHQYAAVLSTFPLLDRTQPRISQEPKSFVTRDVALLAYCELVGEDPPDMPKLLRAIGVELRDPPPEYRRLDARVARYRELGAVPYRPTPKGGRVPDDPELIEAVRSTLSAEALSAEEVAELLDEEEETVRKVLNRLVKAGEAFAEGRGRKRRFYVIGE